MHCPITFASCEELLDQALELPPPDIIVMDINFPGRMSGIEGTRRIVNIIPGLHVIMLTMHLGEDIFFETLHAGASGYLFKMSSPSKIIDAIQEVVIRGAMTLSPGVAQRISDAFDEHHKHKAKSSLTELEKMILKEIISETADNQIASEFTMSQKDLDLHKKQILIKLTLI